MLKHRVIPSLLLSGNGLVKTKQFKNPKYVGDPINAIRIFNDKEVDELMVLDINASKQGKEPNYQMIKDIAEECFMPLCYGGGIRTLAQAKRIFDLGVEKVCLQTSALENPGSVDEIANCFGSQSVMVSVDLKKTWLGKVRLYQASSAKRLDKEWKLFLADIQQAGAGEVLLGAVDLDGTMQGMNLDLIREASSYIKVPLIASGGVGSLTDIKLAIQHGADAVAVGAFFVFHGPHRAVLITYPQYNELEKLLES